MNTSRLWVYKILTSWLPESRAFAFKRALLQWAGAKIGLNVHIYSSAQFIGTGSLVIGDDVHIGADVLMTLVSPYGVTIGSHVDIGPQVSIITGSHKLNSSDDSKDSSDYLCTHMAGEGTGAPVLISDGCWLGARSLILSGVNLPRKTVVAAGSVVTHSVSTRAKCLWAGSPAVVKKEYGPVHSTTTTSNYN